MLKNVLISGVVAVSLLVAQVESIGYGTSGIVGCFSVILIPGVGLSLAIWGLSRRRRDTALRGVALLLAVVVALTASAIGSGVQQRASMRRGDRVCVGIDAYFRATGEYPAELEGLVPTFLPELPTTCMGLFRSFPFHYERHSDGDYLIGFESTFFIQCLRGPDGRWWCDD